MALGRYAAPRPGLYGLLFVLAVVELGLTAFRVHHTNKIFGFYDPIVAALIVTSILTILWVPFGAFVGLRAARNATGSRFSPLHTETGGGFILWVMWLIEAAIATHKWPTVAFANFATDSSKEGHILISIVAFAWLNFSILTIIKGFVLMHYAYLHGGAVGPTAAPVSEKPTQTAQAAPATV